MPPTLHTRPRSRRATLAPAAARLLSELRRVRKDVSDAEAVHDARVAARRLLAAGDLWLPRSGAREALRSRLEKAIRRLGRVRNLDVAAALLARGSRDDAGARRELLGFVRDRRKAERRKLEGWLSEGRARKTQSAIDAALRRRERGVEAGTPGPAALGPRLRRILVLSGRGNPMSDPERAHEIRREVRLLRYAHETIRSEYAPADFGAARALFVRLQDAAGEWHDRLVLRRLAARAARAGKLSAPPDAFLARLRREQGRLGGKFVEGLTDLARIKPVLIGESP